MAIYKWKSGARIKCDAQKAGEQCAKLADAGNLTPAALVAANRSKRAPLHNLFEWDDTIAAERYRESQAAYIIRSVEVTIEGTEAQTRAFVSIEIEDGPQREYTSIEAVLSSTNDRAKLLAQAFADMESFKRKYEELEELADVFAAFDRMAS